MSNIILAFLNALLPILQRIFGLGNPERQNWYNEEEAKFRQASSEIDGDDFAPEIISPIKDNALHITSKYGYRYLNIGGRRVRNFHYGIDIRAYDGTASFAMEECKIIELVQINPAAPCRFRWDAKRSTWVDLKNNAITPRIVYQGLQSGYIYKHKHVRPDGKISVGMLLKAGTKIGVHGNYGYSMGSHLHLEIWQSGKPTDPEKVIRNETELQFI